MNLGALYTLSDSVGITMRAAAVAALVGAAGGAFLGAIAMRSFAGALMFGLYGAALAGCYALLLRFVSAHPGWDELSGPRAGRPTAREGERP